MRAARRAGAQGCGGSGGRDVPLTGRAMCQHEECSMPQGPSGSRRRRIWELGTHAHCPVVGVCLPIRALRRLVDKTVGGMAIAQDYELHCGVIAECTQRTAMAKAVQRELDRRYAIALRQSA